MVFANNAIANAFLLKFANLPTTHKLMIPPLDLPRLFSCIDSALSLHFTSSVSPCKVHQLCSKASSLADKRITSSTIEYILAVFPTAYKIVSYGTSTYDYGVTVRETVPKFNLLIPQRKETFTKSLDSIKDIEPVSLRDVAVPESPKKIPGFRSPSTSPTKVSKLRRMDGLKNDRSKFTLKEKISSVEASKANGLSLLERIKLKERQNSENNANLSEDSRYSADIKSKLTTVYDIVYELALTTPEPQGILKFKSFAFDKITSIVNDSLPFPLPSSQISEIMDLLQKKLGNEKLHSIQRGNTRALRVFHLNREDDMRLLN